MRLSGKPPAATGHSGKHRQSNRRGKGGGYRRKCRIAVPVPACPGAQSLASDDDHFPCRTVIQRGVEHSGLLPGMDFHPVAGVKIQTGRSNRPSPLFIMDLDGIESVLIVALLRRVTDGNNVERHDVVR